MASKTYRICTLPGDGIGPEIIAEAKRLLEAVGTACDVEFACEDQLIGGAAIDATRDDDPVVAAAALKDFANYIQRRFNELTRA